MAEQGIKTGEEIIKDFLTRVASSAQVDQKTLAGINELWLAGKLTKTRLLQLLAEGRKDP